eukprot:1744721-Ditylum_brightwellii.AAC.1
MNISGTFSAPFCRKDLSPTINILKAQPDFKVKLQEEENKYYLYTRTTTNGSTQIQGKPSTVYEDNASIIKTITSECITPTHRHHDVKIST